MNSKGSCSKGAVSALVLLFSCILLVHYILMRTVFQSNYIWKACAILAIHISKGSAHLDGCYDFWCFQLLYCLKYLTSFENISSKEMH